MSRGTQQRTGASVPIYSTTPEISYVRSFASAEQLGYVAATSQTNAAQPYLSASTILSKCRGLDRYRGSSNFTGITFASWTRLILTNPASGGDHDLVENGVSIPSSSGTQPICSPVPLPLVERLGHWQPVRTVGQFHRRGFANCRNTRCSRDGSRRRLSPNLVCASSCSSHDCNRSPSAHILRRRAMSRTSAPIERLIVQLDVTIQTRTRE